MDIWEVEFFKNIWKLIKTKLKFLLTSPKNVYMKKILSTII